MREGPVGVPPIQVLIADQIAHIVEQLAKLADYSDEIQVIGIARQSSDVVAEARLRRPDVLLVSSELGDDATRTLMNELVVASPGTRLLVVTSQPTVNGTSPVAPLVSANASGDELVEAIRRVYAPIAPEPPPPPEADLAPGIPP
ncbi:MAG: hypothetical protein ABR498_08505, partial [Candidatus Dormibacteria bacterium]